MKVLFAVSNEEISESIVKKYQKEYKQIISYKNVYYFNAILKELQKDKSYDRIVISEDLEAFTHTQYDQIDKFIFEKLDGISDEASDSKGNDIPIILISSDRRTKSEEILVKLFGIGIYNAIIGNDRSVDEVCRLINRPRSKKEAKTYYKIDAENVSYQAENENDVSEMEIQNIVAHYKRLGKNEEAYVDSFNNIAAQYNDTQLRIISKFLPLNVRAVLEERSPKYQQVMSFNNSVSNSLRYKNKAEQEKQGPSEKLLTPKNQEKIMTKPVVIPSSVNINSNKKLARQKPKVEPVMNTYIEPVEEEPIIDMLDFEEIDEIPEVKEVPVVMEEIEAVAPVKRGRGRPRKNPVVSEEILESVPKKKRGRPRKIVDIEEAEKETIEEETEMTLLPGFDEIEEQIEEEPEMILPGMQEFEDTTQEETYLPGFDDDDEEEVEDNNIIGNQTQQMQNYQEYQKRMVNEQQQNYQTYQQPTVQTTNYQTYQQPTIMNNSAKNYESTIDLSALLTPGKKIVSFVGTSKNGTSFILNNVAELLSSMGINVAILDTTTNRNSYYIYTKNEEQLRNVASNCIERLTQGIAQGISVNRNLTVYTSLPDENGAIENVDEILQTLIKTHSLILIDTDFATPIGYFKQSQEMYLVQTLDVLTIQPLTAFLRELKAKNILDEKKLKIILNKVVKIRGITDKTIIGGMAYYNDPAMSFMTELFDRNTVKYVSIPFETETYTRYLENIINCDISLKGYSKGFMQTLRELGNIIYPSMNSKNNTYQPPSVGYAQTNQFSPNMNHTLDQMKRNF